MESSPGTTPIESRNESPMEADLRQVCVLSCELRLREIVPGALTDEVRFVLEARFQQLVRRVAQRYGGAPAPLLGRSSTSFFGAPEPCESTAERAVFAALELLRRVVEQSAGLETDWSVGWSLGIGLAAGRAVVSDELVSGGPVEVAPSLSRTAQPGELLVNSELARCLAGRYRFEAGALDLAETSVAEVVQGTVDALKLEGLEEVPADPEIPMVGRVQELSILRELAQRAIEGRGQIVAVTGEAGIGKTRLLAELRRSLAGTRILHLKAPCRPYGGGLFSPWIELVRGAARLNEADSPQAVAEKLRRRLRLIGVDESPPELLALLKKSESPPIAPCADALCRLVLAASRRTPVILEVEDLQWIDPGTRAVLERLAEALGPSRLMILLTDRAGQARALVPLLGRPDATQIALQPLTEAQCQDFVSSLLDDASARPNSSRTDSVGADAVQAIVARAIVARAEGNPYFIRELLQSSATGDDAVEEGRVPVAIQELMTARLSELSGPARRLLRVASVLGRELDVARLEAVWPGPESIEAPLAELRRPRLLVPTAAGEATLSFCHGLLQETLYGSLLPGRRRLLHAKIAAILDAEATELTERELARRADHRREAGDVDASLDDRILLAEKASARGASEPAVDALSEALGDTEFLPSDHGARRVAEIMLPLVEALFSVGRLHSILDLFDAYPEVLDRPDDPGRVGSYEGWRALTLSYLGRPTGAVRAAKRANSLGRRARDESVQGRGRVVLGLEAFAAGDFKKGEEHGLKAIVLLERTDDLWWKSQALEVRAACDLAIGRVDAALEGLEAAEVLRSAIGDWRLSGAWLRLYALGSLGEQGRSAALAASEDLRRQCVDAPSRALLAGALGVLHCRAGNPADAVPALTRAVADLEDLGMRRHGGWFGAWLVRALTLGGDEAAARIALDAAEKSLGDAGFVLGDGELQRARWALARSRDDEDQARAHLDEARAIWSRFGVRLEEESGADGGAPGD